MYLNSERCCAPFQNPLVHDCIDCPWHAAGGETILLYTSNEIIYGTGRVDSSPGSSGAVSVRFLYEQTTVREFRLSPGESAAFTIVGFNFIQIVAEQSGGASEGQLHLLPRYSGL